MDIMDMSLRQIIQATEIHPVKDLVLIGLADNVLAGACGAAGWTKGETFFLKLSKFTGALLAAIGKKASTMAPTAPVSPEKPAGRADTRLLAFVCAMAIVGAGCASYNQHAACFNVQGTNLVTPYGPASGNARFCTETCIGLGCPKAKTQDIADLTNEEIQSSQESIGSIPMTATLKPVK